MASRLEKKISFKIDERKNFVARTRKGLGVGMATAFLIGEMAGAGILNLPAAILDTGE